MIETRGLTYAYGAQQALRDVSLRIGETQLVALTGPNGSGKSTLLKLLARVLRPHGGEVVFLGRPVAEWGGKEYAQQVAYLPQEPESSFPMQAVDVVVSGRAPFLRRFQVEGATDYRKAEEALAMCDAAHLAERYLDEMSGGERKRVFLARVLVGNPRLILLDEPLTALDVAHVQQFSRLLRDVVDRTRATVVFASHDLNWAAAYSDRILAMQRGSVAADVPPSGLMRPDVIRDVFGFDTETVTANGRTWLIPK